MASTAKFCRGQQEVAIKKRCTHFLKKYSLIAWCGIGNVRKIVTLIIINMESCDDDRITSDRIELNNCCKRYNSALPLHITERIIWYIKRIAPNYRYRRP